MATPAHERVIARIERTPSGCWIYRGSISPQGYGQVRVSGRTELTHRVLYAALVGPIPDGLVIDHLCRVRECCNPSHLEPVAQRVNILRGSGPAIAGQYRAAIERAKAECPRGHSYSDANTYITRHGHRQCRTCKRAAQAAYRTRKESA